MSIAGLYPSHADYFGDGKPPLLWESQHEWTPYQYAQAHHGSEGWDLEQEYFDEIWHRRERWEHHRVGEPEARRAHARLYSSQHERDSLFPQEVGYACAFEAVRYYEHHPGLFKFDSMSMIRQTLAYMAISEVYRVWNYLGRPKDSLVMRLASTAAAGTVEAILDESAGRYGGGERGPFYGTSLESSRMGMPAEYSNSSNYTASGIPLTASGLPIDPMSFHGPGHSSRGMGLNMGMGGYNSHMAPAYGSVSALNGGGYGGYGHTYGGGPYGPGYGSGSYHGGYGMGGYGVGYGAGLGYNPTSYGGYGLGGVGGYGNGYNAGYGGGAYPETNYGRYAGSYQGYGRQGGYGAGGMNFGGYGGYGSGAGYGDRSGYGGFGAYGGQGGYGAY